MCITGRGIYTGMHLRSSATGGRSVDTGPSYWFCQGNLHFTVLGGIVASSLRVSVSIIHEFISKLISHTEYSRGASSCEVCKQVFGEIFILNFYAIILST